MLKGLVYAACAVALTGCTGASTCAAIDAAHEAFLAEVAADPAAFTREQIRNERIGYTGASIACTSFVQKSPVAE
jgi:hypothetical protein